MERLFKLRELGAICGTSTVTTFSEVNAGIAAGGKTGLTALYAAT